MFTYLLDSRWVFPKIRVPQNGWFIRENPIIELMIRGYHYFWKHPDSNGPSNKSQPASTSPSAKAIKLPAASDGKWSRKRCLALFRRSTRENNDWQVIKKNKCLWLVLCFSQISIIIWPCLIIMIIFVYFSDAVEVLRCPNFSIIPTDKTEGLISSAW